MLFYTKICFTAWNQVSYPLLLVSFCQRCCVNLCSGYSAMPQKFAHDVEVNTQSEHHCGTGMASLVEYTRQSKQQRIGEYKT